MGTIPLNSSKGREPSAAGGPDGSAAGATTRVFFARRDLDRILWLYGRMVAAGELRDYAIDSFKDHCAFSMFRRSSEAPTYQVEMRPELARRQGAFALIGAHGQVLKRSADVAGILAVLERKLLKLADED